MKIFKIANLGNLILKNRLIHSATFSKFTAKLAEEVKIPIICVGGWQSFDEMEKIFK